MKNNYAVTSMLLFILIILPRFSTANVCLFNQSDVVPRRVFLLNQGNHQHIRIDNATIIICLGKPQEYVSPFLRTLSYRVAVRFTGNVLVIGSESENYVLTVTKLKGVREHFRKSGTGRCSMSFIENEKINDEVQSGVEDAIIRLAQSCIRSVFCQPKINEIDRDANLIYESVQSSLNEIFDYVAPKIMPKNFKSTDYVSDLKYTVVKFGMPLMNFHSFNVTNLSMIRRLRDVVVQSHGSNKFTVSGMFRFNDVNFSLFKSFPYLPKAKLSIFSNYFTIRATFEFKLSFNSCHGKIAFLDFMYADNTTTGDTVVDWALKIGILGKSNKLTAGTSFDCEGPINEAISRILPL